MPRDILKQEKSKYIKEGMSSINGIKIGMLINLVLQFWLLMDVPIIKENVNLEN